MYHIKASISRTRDLVRGGGYRILAVSSVHVLFTGFMGPLT